MELILPDSAMIEPVCLIEEVFHALKSKISTGFATPGPYSLGSLHDSTPRARGHAGLAERFPFFGMAYSSLLFFFG